MRNGWLSGARRGPAQGLGLAAASLLLVTACQPAEPQNSAASAPPPPPPSPPSPPTTTAPARNCDPAYPDPCLRDGIGDYDCAGGSGNGPNYVDGPIKVLPPDPFGLDRDGDGVGCES